MSTHGLVERLQYCRLQSYKSRRNTRSHLAGEAHAPFEVFNAGCIIHHELEDTRQQKSALQMYKYSKCLLDVLTCLSLLTP
jgi:hypothetical protein